MKILTPKTEIWGECPTDMDEAILWIERAGRTCFSDDTEILTENGWKFVHRISKHEKIWTYKQEQNTLELEQSNMFSKDFDGEMIESSHRHSSFCVTPDHRMVAKKAITKNDYAFVEAAELTSTHNNFGYRLPLFFENATIARDDSTETIVMSDHIYYSGNPARKMTVGGKQFQISDEFLTVVSAYISDGHINGANSAIYITKGKHQPLVEELTNALELLGWDYHVSNDRNRAHILSIRISGGKPLGSWFEYNCGRGSLNKQLPTFWKDLSQRQMTHFLSMLYLGDGKRMQEFGSSSKLLIEQINHMYVLIGKSGSIVKHTPTDKGWTKNTHYTTNQNKRNSIIIKPHQIQFVPYKGKVFCPQTTNGIVCMRRKGQVLWIGNCYRSEDKIVEGSGAKFVGNIIKRGHLSVIEHSNLVIRSNESYKFPKNSLDAIRGSYESKFLFFEVVDDHIFIGGNFRAWMEELNKSSIEDLFSHPLRTGFSMVRNHKHIPRNMKTISAEFLTDRAVTHEFVRHRPCSFCLSGDTMIHHFATGDNNSTGKKRTIKTLYEYSKDSRKGRLQLIRLTGMDASGELIPVKIKSVLKSGVKKVYELVTASGRKIKASKKHRFKTPNGWKRLHELVIGDTILCNGVEITRGFVKQRYLVDNVERKKLAKEIGMSDAWLGKKIASWGLQKPKKQYPNRKAGHGVVGMHGNHGCTAISERMIGSGDHRYTGGAHEWKNGNSACCSLYPLDGANCVCGSEAKERHHIDRNTKNNDPTNIEFVCVPCHKARHHDKVKIVFEDKVVSILPVGEEETYDIEIDHTCHNFVANGMVVHNSQESQRYCAYKKHLEVILPQHYTDIPKTKDSDQMHRYQGWVGAMEYAEKTYQQLLALGERPEQARSVLPNSTAATLVATATAIEWDHIFSMRTAPAAYPAIRTAINPVKQHFKKVNLT